MFVDRLIAAFTPDFFARLRGAELETERPVFVVGMLAALVQRSSSGSLVSHPRVFGEQGELELACQTFDSLPEVTGHGGSPAWTV